jgi:hypothetical protein
MPRIALHRRAIRAASRTQRTTVFQILIFSTLLARIRRHAIGTGSRPVVLMVPVYEAAVLEILTFLTIVVHVT